MARTGVDRNNSCAELKLLGIKIVQIKNNLEQKFLEQKFDMDKRCLEQVNMNVILNKSNFEQK